MPDCSWYDLVCHGENAAAGLASGVFERIARQAGQAAAELIVKSFTWWVGTPSVNPDTDAVRGLQHYTMPVALAVLVGSVLLAAVRMVLSRRKEPAVEVGVGLVRFAAVNAVGLTALGLALSAADDVSSWLMDQGAAEFSTRMGTLMGALAVTNPFMLFMFGLLGFLLAALQWVLAFFRQAGVLVLAVMLPLAASGSVGRSSRAWLNRLARWLLTLVTYKPAAALIYLIGLTFMGTGNDVLTVVTGLVVMTLAVIAMPVMLRFFAWSGAAAGGGGGVGGALASGASGAAAVASLRAARAMQMTGPGSGPSGASPSGGFGGGSGGRGTGGPPPVPTSGGGPAPAPTPTGGTGAAGGGAGAAGGGASAAGAAAGPAGAVVVAGVEVARRTYQAGQAAANTMSDPGQQG